MRLRGNSSQSMVNVTWDPASSSYCGEVLYYQVVISSVEHCSIEGNTMYVTGSPATFFNLRDNTSYTVTVSAINRARVGMPEMINITTAVSTGNLHLNRKSNYKYSASFYMNSFSSRHTVVCCVAQESGAPLTYWQYILL